MARRTRSKSTVSAHRPESSEPTRRVAVYTRRSTDVEHQPYSIEAQTLRLDAYVTSQPGWTKVASFSDNTSAKDTHRPGLRAALAAARSGRIDMLLVLKVDRFSRRQRDLVSLVEQAIKIRLEGRREDPVRGEPLQGTAERGKLPTPVPGAPAGASPLQE
jgi:site-specific DNA recombinase